MNNTDNIILSVQDLDVKFTLRGQVLHAIRGVSLDIHQGESLAIVGESGSGKSVFVKSFMGLLDGNGYIDGGAILYHGDDLTKFRTDKEWLKIRGREIAMVLQDPMTSLNPLKTIGKQIQEAVELHQGLHGDAAKKAVLDVLTDVGIDEPERRCKQYPHEFSGGMRQRVMIAMAIINHPAILIADEPTTALDVTIQAQILDIMRRLKGSSGSLMLITHNLGIVAEICEEVVVMYAGRAIERGTLKAIFDNPLHPYTQGLMASVPTMRSEKKPLYTIPGTVPTVYDFKEGCRFADRCQHCTEECRTKIPPVKRVGEDHIVQCWMNFEGEEPYHE